MKYKTKQRDVLLEIIKGFNSEHVTADALFKVIAEKNLDISKATLYRTLESFVNEGVLKKIIIDNKSSACYQYCNHCEDGSSHFHLMCEKCGKLIHLECDDVDDLINHVSKEHNFDINSSKVVLYGLCEECRNK